MNKRKKQIRKQNYDKNLKLVRDKLKDIETQFKVGFKIYEQHHGKEK